MDKNNGKASRADQSALLFDFSGKRVLIIGMARSGIMAARLLLEKGARPVINDIKDAAAFGDKLDSLKGLPIEWRLGEDPLALLHGCDALVISPGVPIDSPAVEKARALGIYMIGELELAAQYAKGLMIGVTGTNGKTTTVTLLGEIFKAAGKRVFVSGNIGTPLSQTAMASADGDVLVTEVSSFQLESIDRWHAKAAAVLNVTEDHLIRHYTMENYIRLKRRVFENQTCEDLAVLNADDPICAAMAEGLPARVRFFSRLAEVENGAFVRDGRMILRDGSRMTDLIDTEEIGIPGPHNLENAMAAALIAWEEGVDEQVIADTLRAFKGVEHRIEFVRELDGVRYINDSKGTNPDSTVKAVDTMKRPTVIILGGYDKHVSFKSLADRIVSSPYIKKVIVLGACAPQLIRELGEAGVSGITRVQTFEEAVEQARFMAQPGWNVLLSPACASFDMFSCFEERGERFKELVRGFVSALGEG